MGQTVMQYRGDHPVADEYRALAREFEDRLSALRTANANSGMKEVVHA